MSKIIMGIKLQKRNETAPKFQEVLSKYGCYISTRLGLHAASADACSPNGIVILEFIQDADETVKEFEKELLALGEVDIQKMIF